MPNKTGKPAFAAGRYFKYAIGEIILVVIGILIAIQLNEWRNDSINTKQKQKVLLALKAEFEANLTQLDKVYYYQTNTLNALNKTMNLIDSINYISDDKVFIETILDMKYEYSYNPTNGALRSAVSSGDIHLIDSQRLIELLFSWEDLVKDSFEESERQNKYASDSYLLLDKYIQLKEVHFEKGSKHPSDFVGLFKDAFFEDYTLRMAFNTYSYKKELEGIRKSNVEIIQSLDQELKK
ncbi:hypothetical protein K8354_04430 [Polaribacter litorisediminis]|uniref:DUF6090 family protein n=1 Tax=Polaribacter litorisediminis TaxID=1908341 RepID=UPI001CBB781D|nr:DUF6090 family protein [Polaribacter litorisediminis]UAM99077.1 hypothetical protein K8354_04430 [Polaribacter litorisediminis]